jgi:Uma2 family endonuclease
MPVSAMPPPVSTPVPSARPDIEHLVTEDDTPVDNLFSEKQQRLLTDPLYASWAGPGQGRPFLAMANVGLFYAVEHPPFVPDMLLSLDVRCPTELWTKRHRSYFMWEYGKPPDVVIEVVSNREGGEDTSKLEGYARVRVPYYAVFDPERWLSDQLLRVYELRRFEYQPMETYEVLPGIGLGLRLWQGVFEEHENLWLRWVDPQGQVIATGRERALLAEQQGQYARQQEKIARQEAQQAQKRAEKLAEQLRQLGVEPDG